MIIGKLDKRITLHKRTFAANVYGERTVDVDTTTVLWADIKFSKGNTKYDADVFVNSEPAEFVIRWTSDIGTSPEYYISSDYGDHYIRGVRELGRREGLILVTEQKDVGNTLDS